jgi:hypothetical protein
MTLATVTVVKVTSVTTARFRSRKVLVESWPATEALMHTMWMCSYNACQKATQDGSANEYVALHGNGNPVIL